MLPRRGKASLHYAVKLRGMICLSRGDLTEPVIEEYKVGPLPKPTSASLLANRKWKNPIPYGTRSVVAPVEFAELMKFLQKEMVALDPLLLDVVGYTYNNCTNHCLT